VRRMAVLAIAIGITFHVSPGVVGSRPDAIAQPKPGISYVDLTRARWADVEPVLPVLAQATAVIFDLRGYPTDAGGRILSHLLETPETTRWMHVARISGPFGQTDGWDAHGWNLKPAAPRITGKAVFLTDERAISYAESVLGYVADLRLATIVGSTTAGTNGNIVNLQLPSGARALFTGMRVTRHDGRSPFHLIGVAPDIRVAVTLAGLRAGRDEVLERALALASGRESDE
jgi:C-terminal processing protease CtpA/Prc